MAKPQILIFEHNALTSDVRAAQQFIDLTEAITLDLSNEQEFAKLVKIAVHRFGVKASAIAKQFGVYRSTIKRWIDATSVPVNSKIRKDVISWLIEQVEQDIESKSSKLSEIKRELEKHKISVTG